MDHNDNIVTDIKADESIKSLVGGKVLPSQEFLDLCNTCRPNTDSINNNHSSQITAPELRLLKAIVENPMRPSSEYPRLAKISPNTFKKLRPIFINRGFIREHKLESGGRGRSTILLEPLESARNFIANNVNYMGNS